MPIVLFTILTAPILSFIYFIYSAVKYSSAKSKNNLNPDTVSSEEMKSLKKSFIISFCLAGFFLVAIILFASTFFMGVAYM